MITPSTYNKGTCIVTVDYPGPSMPMTIQSILPKNEHLKIWSKTKIEAPPNVQWLIMTLMSGEKWSLYTNGHVFPIKYGRFHMMGEAKPGDVWYWDP